MQASSTVISLLSSASSFTSAWPAKAIALFIHLSLVWGLRFLEVLAARVLASLSGLGSGLGWFGIT